MTGGMGGGSLGNNVTGAAGVSSAVAGIAILPNTGGNPLLAVLSIATISVGVLITASFVATRLLTRFYR